MIKRIIVKKDNVYYQCLALSNKIKCGKCLFGLINPFAVKPDHKCKRCGAELAETVYGSGLLNLRSYSP